MNLSSKLLRICTGVQAAAIIAISMPVSTSYAAAPDPNWHVVKTQYKTDDYVIAGYEAKDFGISANGRTDVTEKIQTALDELYKIGGGTLFLPAGRYVVKGTLKIPQGVILAGDWQSPDENNGKAAGTILMAYSGRGENDINDNYDSETENMPFITLEPNASIKGINIWYPEQAPDNIVPYPTTIRMYDPKTWGADSTRISNVTFVNSYNAIRQGPYSSGCPNIENVYISPLHTAVDIDGLADVGRFTNIHISPDYWINSELDNAKECENSLRTYTKENATGIKLGRIDWSYLSFSEIEGCKHGMEFTLSHSVLSYKDGDLNGTMNAWSYPNGQIYNADISGCEVGLFSEGTSGAGMLVAEMNIYDCDTGIEAVNGIESGNGNLEIANSVISGSNYAINYNALSRMCIGNSKIDGNIDIQSSNVSIAGAEFKNCPSITLKNNTDTVLDKNGNLIIKTGQLIISSSDNLPAIDNQNSSQVIHNTSQYMPPNVSSITEEPNLVTKPYKPDIFVVTNAPYNAPHNEVDFQKFNSPCEQDASAAIQQALDDAEANGGGIVFCPPGRYTLKSPLSVAAGVELRGAIDHTRLPIKLGTIFDTVVPENEFLNTSFTELNTKTVDGIDNVLSGNSIFGEVPSPIVNEDGTAARSVTVTPYGLRLYSAAAAEQAHAFDHSTQLECGKSDSKYIIEAVVSPKSIKENGEFFITLSRHDAGTNKNADAFRIANFKANGNILELLGGVKTEFLNDEMYSFRWELDLTDINNKTITTTVIATKGNQKGEIFKSAAKFPDAYQGNVDNVGHILLQASKVSGESSGESEVYIHGASVQRDNELNEPAWVMLRGGSGINGITFNCTGQKYLPSPNPSPYMIRGQGNNIYVKNIALRNVYDGIDFKTYSCNNHYINGVAGIAWHSEIDIANSDNGVIANTQFNWGSLLYGSQNKLGCWEDSPINSYTDANGSNIDPRSSVNEPYMEKYMSMNLDCVTVDNCKNILLYNNFSIFGSSSLTLKGDTKGLCIGQGADGSRFGLRVADNANVDFVNTQIVSFYYTDSSHITADEGYGGRCDFLNTSAWSTPSANIRSNGGEIYMYNSTFNGVSRTAFADLSNDAYVFLQTGWINNANANTVQPVIGENNISFRDLFFNRNYNSLPETTKQPSDKPNSEPRAPLNPRPGTYYPLNSKPTYIAELNETTEFNRIQLVWEEEQSDDVRVNVNGIILEGTVNGKTLNLLNGAAEASEKNSNSEVFNLYNLTADHIEITAENKPIVKLYKDENLQYKITATGSELLSSPEYMFDGNKASDSNFSMFWHVDPKATPSSSFVSASFDKEYSISQLALYAWGPNGWYPKGFDISTHSFTAQSPAEIGYPRSLPYVLSSTLDITADEFTITFPEGGYSDINNPDTKEDGSVQYKYGFRLFELELYGSVDSVWSGDVSVIPSEKPVTIPEVTNTPEPTNTPESTSIPEPTNTPDIPHTTDTPAPDKDFLALTATESDSGLTFTATAMLAQPFSNPYTAILALYDNSGVLISVRMHSVKESPEENTLIFENITVPNIEYYKVALFRWNDIDGEFGMMPVAEPIFSVYTSTKTQ